MKLEQQVCSLELAQKLKELGVKQESQFIWVESGIFGVKLSPENETFDLEMHGSIQRLASAFTVAELGEMLLPKDPEYKFRKGAHSVQVVNCGWIYGDTEADARAKTLIYLLENGLLKN